MDGRVLTHVQHVGGCGATCVGMSSSRTARATREAGPSSQYSMSMATMMRSGEEMRPMMFWHSSCAAGQAQSTSSPW